MIIMIVANIINIGANYVWSMACMAFPNWVPKAPSGRRSLSGSRRSSLFCPMSGFSRPRKIWHRSTGLGWRAAREMRRIGYASGVSMGVENAAFNAGAVWRAARHGCAGGPCHHHQCVCLVFHDGLGFGVATAVSVGNAYGAGDMARVYRWVWVGLGLQTGVMMVGVLIMYFYADFAAGLFTEDAAVAKLAATMIGYASIALIFDTGQSLFAMSYERDETHGIRRLFIF